jgi:hypothetical protein
MKRCIAQTAKKTQCKFTAKDNGSLCAKHTNIQNKGKEINPPAHNANDDLEPDAPEPQIVDDMVDMIKPDEPEPQIVADPVESNPTDQAECPCCCDTFDRQMMIWCNTNTTASATVTPRSHGTCKDCFRSGLDSMINSKKKVSCIVDPKCCGGYKDSDIMDILDDKTLQRYVEYLEIDQATKLASVLDNYYLCPFCSKYGIIIENVVGFNHQHIQTIRCMNEKCQVEWCIRCRKAYHGADPCNILYSANRDVIRKTIDETIDCATIHNCPKCFTKYSKDDGCNLMTCPSCKSYSCYLCNVLIVPINGLKYSHFKGSGSALPNAKCELYNTKIVDNDQNIKKGNVDHNNKNVINALDHLIQINQNNPDVVRAIKEDLFSRGYKKYKNIIKKPVLKKPVLEKPMLKKPVLEKPALKQSDFKKVRNAMIDDNFNMAMEGMRKNRKGRVGK